MSWTPRPLPAPRTWVAARRLAVAAAGALAVALLLRPSEAARFVWFGVVPLLPFVFLVNAEAWRNVCPLATLGSFGARDDAPRSLGRPGARTATAVGIVLFLLLVPARHLAFNDGGLATLALLGAAGLAALAGGRAFGGKAGFCNSVCPVLPVERLYGQRPLLRVPNARCAPCRACTRHACFDLNPERSGLVSMGAAAAGRGWVLTPFGAFALAFPGLVMGFAAVANAEPVDAARVYGLVLFGAVASWTLLAAISTVARVRPAAGLFAAATLAATAYAWTTPSAVASAWDLGLPAVTGLRAGGLILVSLWVVRAAGGGPPRTIRSPAPIPVGLDS